jgi:hypothetical protein
MLPNTTKRYHDLSGMAINNITQYAAVTTKGSQPTENLKDFKDPDILTLNIKIETQTEAVQNITMIVEKRNQSISGLIQK